MTISANFAARRELLHIGNDLPEMVANSDEERVAITALAALWDEPMVYVKQFAEATASVTCGYFLSWFTSKCSPGEWVALNDTVVRDGTGLSKNQWFRIRAHLTEAGILRNRRTEERVSLYTLDDDALENLLRRRGDTALLAVVAPPLTLNRLHTSMLLHAGMSCKACVLLAYLQQNSPELPPHERGDFGVWVFLSDDAVRGHTYLSRRDLVTAMRMLVDAGIIETVTRGMPRCRFGRINAKRLGELSLHYLQQQNLQQQS